MLRCVFEGMHSNLIWRKCQNFGKQDVTVGVLHHGHVLRYYRYCRHDDILLPIRTDACAAKHPAFSDC